MQAVDRAREVRSKAVQVAMVEGRKDAHALGRTQQREEGLALAKPAHGVTYTYIVFVNELFGPAPRPLVTGRDHARRLDGHESLKRPRSFGRARVRLQQFEGFP